MLAIHNPFTGETIKTIVLEDQNDLEKKIQKSNQILKTDPLAPHQRISLLERAKELMKIRKAEVIHTACSEGGKPLMDTQVEMDRAINGIQLAIEAISQLKGEEVPMGLTAASTNRIAFTTKEPIGVVAAISAFNHPINLIVHQAITAIAAGCPVIIKPSLKTPLSCLLLQDILLQAGLPEAYFQVLIAEDEVAELLATSEQIAFLSFIGSAKVGWYLRSKLAPGVRCAMEHGGAAPVVVCPDANLPELLPALSKGAFYHAGQVCVSVQRVYVHNSILVQVVGGLAEHASQLQVDDPLTENCEVGPLIDPKEVDRVDQWVQEAIQEGAELVYGGRKLNDYCYSPTVLLNPSAESKVSQLEIFGPVVCVYSHATEEETITAANAIPFHFQASVWTENLNKALKHVKALDATAVMVNDHTAFRVDWMPFGGRDQSGLGLGGILHSMKDMSKEKLVVIKSEVL